ncbi:unnamed protein product [Didymodactylos carnosus]|uniref:NAD(P)(+)--arginine ADP-ribosyltransferase n=1 Tax=Didymodactylos carnosus TaxID=1234261 RepID=A0A814UC11_9BILA|nr:unnamed protein product [Didymodactylos carnosus]CAF1230178.1 unnamed protein product [Didymodactylos carnosus]CAF3936742.1 unnamed protein product [Didymodactylos carnosus]CAF4038206.1 unnamed protein product [Didymodactylos carnosus]
MNTEKATTSAASTSVVKSAEVTISLLSSAKRSVWSWQSNPNPWVLNETKEWTRYSDFETEFIEDKYLKKEESEVEVGDYVVDLKSMVQISKADRNKQRSVKREEVPVRDFLREERFSYPEKAVKSFGTTYRSKVIMEWKKRNKAIDGHWPETVEQAAQGILKEGKLLKQEFESQLIAEKLRDVKDKPYEIFHCCARLYSAESFLYKLVNTTLRNEDMTKVDTLGAYCNVLRYYLRLNTQGPGKTAFYRGCTLTNEMIDGYIQAVGTQITWPAFTSTSKSRQQAEQFGNTLFIIRPSGRMGGQLRDISYLSHYPHEEEVLIVAGHCYDVDKVEHNPDNGKYLIYLTAG